MSPEEFERNHKLRVAPGGMAQLLQGATPGTVDVNAASSFH